MTILSCLRGLLFGLLCIRVVDTTNTVFDIPDFFTRSGPWGPAHCAVLVFADGLGARHTALEPLFSLGDDWWKGTTVAPAGDASSSVLALRGGCLRPLWRHFVRGRAAYGLVTSKCADDGTSAGFLVTPSDRYDLSSVASSIVSLRPPPFIVSGGFSRSLWEKSLNVPFVEFDTSGATAYAERCEYPPPATLPERVSRALRLGASAGGSRGFFLAVVAADVDLASHARNGARVNASLVALRTMLDESAAKLSSTCPGAWRVVVVGSHATGGPDGGAEGQHGHHSPDGTPVPVLIAGQDASGNQVAGVLRTRSLLAYDEVARMAAPGLVCKSTNYHPVIRRPGEKTTSTYRPNDHHHGVHNATYAGWEASVYIFFCITILVLLGSFSFLPLNN
jgi:hypothetical protein